MQKETNEEGYIGCKEVKITEEKGQDRGGEGRRKLKKICNSQMRNRSSHFSGNYTKNKSMVNINIRIVYSMLCLWEDKDQKY